MRWKIIASTPLRIIDKIYYFKNEILTFRYPFSAMWVNSTGQSYQTIPRDYTGNKIVD
jgi:hypothetical protein